MKDGNDEGTGPFVEKGIAGSELHKARFCKSVPCQQIAEVEVSGEDDIVVLFGPFENSEVFYSLFSDVQPVDGVEAFFPKKLFPGRRKTLVDEDFQVGINSYSSPRTLSAAKCRACSMSSRRRLG